MIAYYIVFAAILCGLVLRYDTPELENTILYFFGCILVCFAGFRGVGVDKDIVNYWNMFDYSTSLNDFPEQEVMAKFIPVSLKLLNIYSFWFAIFIFAFLSVILKVYAIKKYSYAPLLSILYFFSWLFLLQDFTQIRAAVAVGILLFAIEDVYNRKLIRFTIKVAFACLFHYSSLLILPLYFVNKDQISKKSYLGFLVVFIVLGLQKAVNVFTIIPGIALISAKLNSYMMLQGVTEINVLNTTSLVNLMIVVVLIANYEKIRNYSKYSVIFIKQSYFSCLSYLILSGVPVLAFRVSELYAVANIITISYFSVIFKKQVYFIIFVFIISLILLSLNLFKQKLVGPYVTILF